MHTAFYMCESLAITAGKKQLYAEKWVSTLIVCFARRNIAEMPDIFKLGARNTVKNPVIGSAE